MARKLPGSHLQGARELAIRHAAIWLGLPQATVRREFRAAARDGIDCVRLWAPRVPPERVLQWHATKSPDFLSSLTE